MSTASRFRLSRCGVLNVWQYDEQVFECSEGRLLLRGANGAGKSKTLEMLLPFTLDGDKLRITASGRHHTSLLWLMTDGFEGNRTGYLWVEFTRDTEDGGTEHLTCGVGVRASTTARTASTWYFTCPRRVGVDLLLEDDAGPLPRERLREAVAADGHFFDQGRPYKHHVGRTLFGLDPAQYDELLRLLYWLRQPQVGEDIEPAKLAEQLSQALPPVDDEAIRSAGDTFDELAAFGEQIDRRRRAAEAIAAFARVYARYAATTVRTHGQALVVSHREQSRRVAAVTAAHAAEETARSELAAAVDSLADAERRRETAQARERELQSSPEARSHQRLLELDAQSARASAEAARADVAVEHARTRAEESGEQVSADSERITAEVGQHLRRSQEWVAERQQSGGTGWVLATAWFDGERLGTSDDAEAMHGRLEVHRGSLAGLLPLLGELAAAIRIVDDARRAAEEAARRRDVEARRAAEAESRAEAERGRRADAVAAARAAEARFAEDIERWTADSRGLPVTLPELTAEAIGAIGAVARRQAAAELGRLEETRAAAAAERVGAERAIAVLSQQRVAIEAERDPAPPEPSLERSEREASEGAPLWRLIDFGPGLGAAERAAVEAALEASGLLDAWVHRDGSVLVAGRLDTVLPLGPEAGGDTLAGVLVADVPAGCPVPADVVRGVLGRIAWVEGPDGSAAPDPGPAVRADGSWRLGPLTGRAAKPVAQYVGATARAEERARRLAAVDADLDRYESERASASAREQAAADRMAEIDSWLAEVPEHRYLLQAWTLLDEREAGVVRAEADAVEAEDLATRARAEAAARQGELAGLADQHGLPVTADGLAARREELRSAETRLRRLLDDLSPLSERLQRWGRDWRRWQADLDLLRTATMEADERARAAAAAAAQLAALRDSVGADVLELQGRLAQTRQAIEEATRDERHLRVRVDGAREAVGEARAQAVAAEARRDDYAPIVAASAEDLAGLVEVPGLLRSALGREPEVEELAALGLAAEMQGTSVPRRLVEVAAGFSRLDSAGSPAETGEPGGADAAGRTAGDAARAAVLAAWQDAASSDAADHEPRLATCRGDVLAALARDDGGERPVAALAARLEAAVVRDSELLTERERALFEEHLIGDLGEVLRLRRLEATELVTEMNRLLAGVTTSQGIRVQLRWRLRDDVPADARRAMELLGRSVGALLPSERTELRDALHRLIEASRADAPEESYDEHLARALDYRRWHAFRVRYSRPESAGDWLDLHRRSPLSQGEQKVVCYLPLFAAAAAHYTSLAGAAPYAPRLVLLDDAFPKIDVRTHPLLFGLLVDLDLDFVITSERLWGDHETVPSLDIYEALRDPTERGIAQFRYHWDGARLQAVGA